MLKLTAAASALLLLGACAVTPSYGPAAGPDDYGYLDQRIEDTRYRVSYKGRSYDDASSGALRRAAEITVAQGYDYFTVVSRSAESEDGRGGPRIGVGGSTGGWRGGGVGVGVSVPLGGDGERESISRLEFVMGRGVAPQGPTSYNARQVISNLVGAQ
jgi:hypothetical protein